MLAVLPATVSEPWRSLLLLFAVYLKVTVPLPVPLAPEVTAIHESLLDAVHVHPLLVDTAIEPEPASESTR
jgi:hypothetical protein